MLVKRRFIAAAALVISLWPSYLLARVSRYCKVSYETRAGWSDEYMHEVTFLTGTELNRATKSFNYRAFEKYALVWFERGEVAIIRLRGIIFTGVEFSADDFRNMFFVKQAIDGDQVNIEEERNWRIRGKDFLRYFDPRAEAAK